MLSISMAYNVISCNKNWKKHSKNQNRWFYNVIMYYNNCNNDNNDNNDTDNWMPSLHLFDEQNVIYHGHNDDDYDNINYRLW